MIIKTEIMQDVSIDPYFKIKFSYESENVLLEKGYAEIIRKAPISVITYDDNTSEKLKYEDKTKLELEILNTIIGYLLSRGTTRTSTGKVIIQTAPSPKKF